MKLGADAYHKRLPEFESFDRIELTVIPRYKTSGLSGDEWRQHVEISFYFKGEKVHSAGARDMDAAILMLGHHWITAHEPIPDRVIDLEADHCDQPSCKNKSVVRYVLRDEFSRNGEKLDQADRHGTHYRQFCDEHKTRGDCDREDADVNYVMLTGVSV